jgi:hypothetical protein
MRIDSIDEWHNVAQRLADDCYTLWQTQYDVDDEHGFIARYLTVDNRKPRLEFVTFNPIIRDAMLRYKL